MEVKIIRPKYEPTTGEFIGLYETIGFIAVRGDAYEHFLNYGYDKNKCRLLYSFYKRWIPNSFGGTIFTRHRFMFKMVNLTQNFQSCIFLFHLSLIDVRNKSTYEMCQYWPFWSVWERDWWWFSAKFPWFWKEKDGLFCYWCVEIICQNIQF